MSFLIASILIFAGTCMVLKAQSMQVRHVKVRIKR